MAILVVSSTRMYRFPPWPSSSRPSAITWQFLSCFGSDTPNASRKVFAVFLGRRMAIPCPFRNRLFPSFGQVITPPIGHEPGLAVAHWSGVCIGCIFKTAKVFRSVDLATPCDVQLHVQVGVVREVPETSQVGAEAGRLLVAWGSAAVGVHGAGPGSAGPAGCAAAAPDAVPGINKG